MNKKAMAGRSAITKKGYVFLAIIALAASVIIYRLADISLVNYENYQNKTIEQFTDETTISAKRGTIYDRNMRVLAISATVERIFISPNTIPNMTVREYIDDIVEHTSGGDEEKQAVREKLTAQFDNLGITVGEDIANELSQILGVDRDTILTKVAKTGRKDETIKNKVELEVSSLVHQLVQDKYYTNYIHFAEDTKRYYPYGNLASHVIGFTGTENTGLAGLEAYYETLLKGTPGKIVTAKNARGGEMSFKYESYISANNGTNFVSTLDWTVQRILDKHLETALVETGAENRVLGIVMDVNNGEILGLCIKPDFDLNDPFNLDEASLKLLEEFIGTDEEKAKYKSDLLYAMWKNKAISEIYEPGSTFKMITASMAIEENLVNETETFNCTGYMKLPGYPKPIGCHLTSGHGIQTFEEGIWHSCNPVFMTVGERVGNENFYKYYRAFGYNERTGIDLPGETTGLFFDVAGGNFRSVELAVASFGQTFKNTPIQHLVATAAVANGGYIVTPHFFKCTVDDEGNVIDNYSADLKRQVVSTETCQRVIRYMENGVNNGGSSRNAYVKGYRVAAKTGTSVKTDVRTETGNTYYIGSCVAFAPADAPQIAVMVLIDTPTTGSYYGGTIAAPVVSKVLAEVLPYLGVEPSYDDAELESIAFPISDYRGMKVSDACVDIKKNSLTYKIIGSGETVVDQVPRAASSLTKDSVIVLYTESEPEATVRVPDVIGKTASAANKAIVDAGLNIIIEGSHQEMLDGAVAIKQSPDSGEYVSPGTIVSVEFRHEGTD